MNPSKQPSLFFQVLLHNPNILLWTLFLSGLAWRIIYWELDFPQGGDETFVALSVMTKSFGEMLKGLEYGQVVPVGFMWLELIVAKILGFSGWSLRLIPTLGLILSLVLFWRIGLKVLSPWEACLAVGFFAASSSLAQAQIKPYAMDILASTTLLWAALRMRSSLAYFKSWMILTLLGAFSVWVSYPAVFVNGGLILFFSGLALKNKEEFNPGYLLFYSLVFGLNVGLMTVVGAEAQTAASDWLWKLKVWEEAYPPAKEFWRMPWWLIKTHLGFMFSLIRVDNYGIAVPTAFLAWIGAVVLTKKGQGRLVLLGLAPLVPAMVAAFLKLYPYGGSVRTMLYMAPFFCLLAGYGLSSLYRLFFPETVQTFWLTSLIFVLMIGHSILGDIKEPHYKPSHLTARAVIKQLSREASPNDHWIIFGLNGPAPSARDSITASYEPCFRSNVITYLKGSIWWNPRPENIPVNRHGLTHLLVSRDRQLGEINEAWLGAFLNHLGRRQVLFNKRLFILDKDPENFWSLELYTFQPQGPA